MINTNDGYFFASGAQHELFGLHGNNPRVPSFWSYGLVAVTTLVTKFTPFSLETVTLYLPTVISSMVVIPIILIARLYKLTLWGFFAALLGSIAWSYYNRTMTGYYDTDMFSAMAPMFILYFLMKSTIDFNLKSALYAAIAISIYPLLYDQGQAIIYAMGIIYTAYMLFYHRENDVTYKSLILLFLALIPFHLSAPLEYIVDIALVVITYFLLLKSEIETKKLMLISLVLFIAFMIFGDVLSLIWHKIYSYTITGTDKSGLHFFAVNQTVREAGHIPFKTFANRISGSEVGLFIAMLGYLVLLFKKPAFLLALPLVGIGGFALFGGLRFTVYAVPIAAMSAVYLFFFIGEYIKNSKVKYAFIALATAFMIYPNITHIIGYKVPTVFNKAEVKDLVALNKIATDKDYTLAWWDYGYPIWYYSDTSTIIDGGKHDHDNYIISKIMFSDSSVQVVNLARLAVETYVDSNYSIISDTLLKDKNPNQLMSDLKETNFKLPKKTRDVYLYLPFRMINILPTVGVFGNLNLENGKKERNIVFYPASPIKQRGSMISLSNGIALDIAKGVASLGKRKIPVNHFDIAVLDKNGQTRVESNIFHSDAGFSVVYLKSYNKMIFMDNKTYNSTFVQMFMLGHYDKKLFKLVVSSPYTKIYKLKI
ncbi:Oligosaccharyltransferase PglB [hydrothermal vent metagenome]|uniref:Oligosaccharyltransferase PglB n=1 Tax=hydrothermal vent metagenome TaxID=652676 RepID=A0A1W1CJX6_9ZZZZ